MQLTHLGHASLLVEVADLRVLLDPGAFSPGAFDQRELDLVLITHQHPDHVDVDRLPELLRAAGDPRVLTDPGTAEVLGDKGIEVTSLREGDEVEHGGLVVRGVGDQHAVINEALERITNTGMLLRADGEPTLFHSGDALDAEPGRVDVLSFALNAPWQASKETAAFLQRIAAPHVVPVHDALLSEVGRGGYIAQMRQFGHPDSELHDLADGSPRTFAAGAA